MQKGPGQAWNLVFYDRGNSRITTMMGVVYRPQPWLAGTRTSPFWMLLELRMMEVVSGDNWCPSGCVVECWICNREVAGSNLGLGYKGTEVAHVTRRLFSRWKGQRSGPVNWAFWNVCLLFLLLLLLLIIVLLYFVSVICRFQWLIYTAFRYSLTSVKMYKLFSLTFSVWSRLSNDSVVALLYNFCAKESSVILLWKK